MTGASLAFASYSIVPVDEGALRVVSPSPHVQFEEWVEIEAVRCADQLEGLAVEHRGSVVVVLEPGGRVDDEFHSDQPAPVSNGLVDERFRARIVQFAVADQGPVDIVDAHRAVIRSADATKCG